MKRNEKRCVLSKGPGNGSAWSKNDIFLRFRYVFSILEYCGETYFDDDDDDDDDDVDDDEFVMVD